MLMARNIREVQNRLNSILGYNTKVVECVGKKLKGLLPNTDPWSGHPCGREACILRGNTLYSKAGYNRSGIARLTLKPEEYLANKSLDESERRATRRLAKSVEEV